MRYLLLIYTPEPPEATRPRSRGYESSDVQRVHQDVRAAGPYKAGEALHPTSSATTVRVSDGQTIATDGPFAETKEALGGFYLVNARDLDEAIELAAQIPAARHGSIEVRPIFDFDAERQRAATARPVAGRPPDGSRCRSRAPIRTPSSTASSARSRAGRSRR